jgi:hypothetical protein
MRRHRRQRVLGFFLPLVALVALAAVAPAANAVPGAAKLPDSCTLVTKADVTTAFAKLDAALQPTSVSDPTPSKPTNQGGFGPRACETVFFLPNSVSGRVLVTANPIVASIGCPTKGQPGKKTTISGAKALLEPIPGQPSVVRDVAFVDKKACATIQIFLSGGANKVPASGFVDLAKAALAK